MKPPLLFQPFATTNEYYDEVRLLADDLAHSGDTAAGEELREGLGCLNGLTDGWAHFLGAIDAVAAAYGRDLPALQGRRQGR